ncbi:MAG: potassium channel family protein [Capsulimonadaceae bacterium]|nr:potassium channel family protein [Capsulimonadaceae bacterium]
MHLFALIIGFALLAFVLRDAFETLVLPRSANSSLRLTAFFYTVIWSGWRWIARRLRKPNQREAHLWAFGPLSLILLMAVWAILLVFGFGILQWSAGSHLHAPEDNPGFWTDIYLSGTTLFTLGYGDVSPLSPVARAISVTEAGVGFGFLAIVIGYLPVLYQGFSRREVAISLLDARAGSPPTASELLKRHALPVTRACTLEALLADWEKWAAELLESHLSYPALSFYRSQHDRQSWLASLTCILDTSALVIAGVGGSADRQARLTFAMCRHALIDLSLILNTPPCAPRFPRLDAAGFDQLTSGLIQEDVTFERPDCIDELTRLRALYEPYAVVLADYLMVDLPPWQISLPVLDNWEASAWETNSAADDDWVLHPHSS